MEKLQARFLAFLRNFLIALLPSFLRSSNDQGIPSHSKSRLLVLEGLRGFACVVVFNYHLFKNLVGGPTSERATWHQDRPAFFQWPWIYMFSNGRGMVFVFWVLSGYALASKPAKLLHNGDPTGCNNALASSLIRRGFRLFLPPMVGVFITAFICWLGLFEPARKVRHDAALDNYLQLLEDVPPSFPNLFVQMNDAFWSSLNLLNILGGYSEQPGPYNDTYWVIPIQYRASLFIYLILLANSRLKSRYRTILPWILTILTFSWQRPDLVTHFGGLILAALDLSTNNHHPSTNQPTLPTLPQTGITTTAIPTSPSLLTLKNYTLFILGTLFLSVPGASWPAQAISSLFTTRLPILMFNANDGIGIIGALLTIHSLIHLPALHPLLTNKPMLYLGKISFSFYLVHGVVIRCWFYAVLPWIYRLASVEGGNLDRDSIGQGQVLFVYAAAMGVCFPVVVWIADLFYRGVENGCEVLGAWVCGKVVVAERL